MTDSELVDLVRRGDHAAFAALVDRHRTAVYRTAFAALGTEQEAEEVAQDAFIIAFRRIADFRGEASFRSWLLTIAWRRALSHRRTVVRRLRRVVGLGSEAWPEPPALDPSPEAALLDGDLRRQVRRLIRALPAALRDALLMTAASPETYEEVAAVLGIPVGTLKYRVADARKRLKVKLARLGYRDD